MLFAFMVETMRTGEWCDSLSSSSSSGSKKKLGTGVGGAGEGEEIYVWWHSAEEWASILLKWVEETGQRNTVLTFYELLEGDATNECEWRGMGEEVLGRVVSVLVRRGRAGLLGEAGAEGRGVKIW